LHNIKHVVALKRNLISIGQLDDEGHHTTFGDGAWKVTKGNLIVARGKKRGSLYMTANEDMVVVTKAVNNSTMWHPRLGHMSEKGMKLMAAKGKLSSLKHVDVGFCEHVSLESRKRLASQGKGRLLKLKS